MVFSHIHAVDLTVVEQILTCRCNLHPPVALRKLIAGRLRQCPLYLTRKDAVGRNMRQLRQVTVFRFRIGLLRQHKDCRAAHRQRAQHEQHIQPFDMLFARFCFSFHFSKPPQIGHPPHSNL